MAKKKVEVVTGNGSVTVNKFVWDEKTCTWVLESSFYKNIKRS